MHGVISSLKDFDKVFSKSPKAGERREALQKYFGVNGVIKAVEANKEWPKLLYPSIEVLDSKIKESKERRKIFASKLSEWKKNHFNASMYHQVNQVKKFAEPVYWKHLAKTISDKDYRIDADSVKLPAHLVADKKWRPMVKMFVNDIEYRKQLAETVNTSIVYKKNKRVAKFADDLQDFRMDAADKQVKDLEEKVSDLESVEKSLKEMQKWAKE
ncbi:MAG: hypothetical protein NTY48_01475 [Candidatus Diapherotrites archaeon]|nr:hypothetical protein [Candidatus Diapherotrites archaeon]